MKLKNRNHNIFFNLHFQLLLVEKEKVEVEEAVEDDMELQEALLEVAHMDLAIVSMKCGHLFHKIKSTNFELFEIL